MSSVIVGLGETGFATVEYFAKKNIPCVVLDSRDNPPHLADLKKYFPQIPVYTGGFLPSILKTAKTLILSPGIPKDHPELLKNLPENVEIIGDIELFARNLSELTPPLQKAAPVVAITGSNGKSTVTSLVGEMAKSAGLHVGVGGNLGVPALSLLDPQCEMYVLELSSFQLETTYSLKPTVSTLLNLCPDHLDRYDNLEDYFVAKARIFQHAEKLVVNREDDYVLSRTPKEIPHISFGLDEPPSDSSYGILEDHLARGKTKLMPVSELKLMGRHNIANALAALALGESVGLPLPAMLSALKNFKGLAHRCEWVREYKGVIWINDSKGTNVGATLAALQGLGQEIPGKWVMIAGGLGKNADFSPLKPLIAQYCSAVILIGEAGEELQTLLKDAVPCVRAYSMAEAVQKASTIAKAQDGVLLSPACASFDMFRNFEDRGNVFKEVVLSL